MIFDLFETLVAWPAEEARALTDLLGIERSRWSETSGMRWTLSLPEYFRALGADDELAARAAAFRTETSRSALVPFAGALDVLDELRSRNYRLGLVSNCSAEIEELWPETSLAGRFDCALFSPQVGLCKPDPRIYRLALERLGVESREAVFVGDGGSDELAGAERVGIRAIGLGSPPRWRGATIERLDDLLTLLPNGGIE